MDNLEPLDLGDRPTKCLNRLRLEVLYLRLDARTAPFVRVVHPRPIFRELENVTSIIVRKFANHLQCVLDAGVNLIGPRLINSVEILVMTCSKARRSCRACSPVFAGDIYDQSIKVGEFYPPSRTRALT